MEQDLPLAPHYSLFFIVLSATILFLVFRSVLNPLSRLPGPLLSRWTNIRLKINILLGNRMNYVHKLHAQYGPVVRISPGEVSIADLPTVKRIHKVSSHFHKSPWYFTFTNGKVNTFTMADPAQHAARRKLLAQPMSESGLKSFEDHVKSKVQLTVKRLSEEEGARGCADVLKWVSAQVLMQFHSFPVGYGP